MEMGSWARVPHVALVQVFGYMDLADRTRSSHVCTSWKAVYSDPSVWKNVVHRIETSPRHFQDIVTRYGKHFRHLELVWGSYPNEWTAQCSAPGDPVAPQANLMVLVSHRVQVKSLTLVDWVKSSKWPNRNKLMMTLTKFLRMQENLTVLRFPNGYMRQNEVFHLTCAATTSGLKVLDLRSAFRERQDPYEHPRYLTVIRNATSLQSLSVDYRAISDEVIDALCEATPRLNTLQIVARPSDIRHPPIMESSWEKIRNALKCLEVHFHIYNLSYHEEIVYFLKPSIPLHVLHLNIGKTWDPSQMEHFRKTLAHITTCYSSSLEDVSIRLKYCPEYVDDLLVKMVKECGRLRKFFYDGVLRNLDAADELVHITVCDNRFKFIEIIPKFVTRRNHKTIYEIMKTYEVKCSQKSIHFKIWDPSLKLTYI